MSVFDFSDYRAFIQHQIQLNKSVRGYQSLLAAQAGCQRSFLSQALNSHVELTPDQGANLCRYWNFDEDETEYFLSLLGLSRAASKSLKSHLERKISRLKRQKEKLVSRFKEPPRLEETQAHFYYSAWHWSAIHVGVSIPALQTSAALAARLRLPEDLVTSCLEVLAQMGLVVKKGGNKWNVTQHSLHLPEDSSFNRINHLNWRLKAYQDPSLQERSKNLHYTAVHALASRDVPRLRQALVEAIEKTRLIVAPSPEEEMVCVSCDLIGL